MRFFSLILFLLPKVSMVLFFESLYSEIIIVCQVLIIPYNYIFCPHPCWCMTEWWNNAMLSGCWNWQNGLATNWWILEANTCFSFWFTWTWLDTSNQVSLPWNFSFYRSMRAGTSSLLFTTVYPELNKCLAYSRHSINIIEIINKMNCSN